MSKKVGCLICNDTGKFTNPFDQEYDCNCKKKANRAKTRVMPKIAEITKTGGIEKRLYDYLTDKEVYSNYERNFVLPDDAEIVSRYVGVFIRKMLVDIRRELESNFTA
ncbi:MAG: hypothetical protein ABIG69_06705 [Bacteroidota bacterium]